MAEQLLVDVDDYPMPRFSLDRPEFVTQDVVQYAPISDGYPSRPEPQEADRG